MNSKVRITDESLTILADNYDLNQFNNIYIIGGGKATLEMSISLIMMLEKSDYYNYQAVINIQRGIDFDETGFPNKLKVYYASHPIPNEEGVKGLKEMIKLIHEANSDDLIIALISGGGSALLPYPSPGIKLEEIQKVNSLLLKSGASIHEINAIRKHISQLKGGNLAKIVYKNSGAQLISLIISDVVGNDLDVIASGPTVPDSSTYRDAMDVLEKYEILTEIPQSINNHIKEGLEDSKLETPKDGDPCFDNVHNYLIGSVESAIPDVTRYLNNQSYQTYYFSNQISGEAKEFGKDLFKKVEAYIQKMKKKDINKLALLASGELTVTVTGDGIGGRNQEMLLSFVTAGMEKQISSDFLIIGANLDGIEGNSEAMGGLVDSKVIQLTKSLKLNPTEYLKRNNSNEFFQQVNTEIITGPTGCNVNDLVIILLRK
jgi:glycerate-2-kinase